MDLEDQAITKRGLGVCTRSLEDSVGGDAGDIADLKSL
jgi:hypothetical protein